MNREGIGGIEESNGGMSNRKCRRDGDRKKGREATASLKDQEIKTDRKVIKKDRKEDIKKDRKGRKDRKEERRWIEIERKIGR